MGPLADQMQKAGFKACCHLLEDGYKFHMHRATIARITIVHFTK